MKKTILILILFLVSFSAFAQEKDSTDYFSIDRKAHFGISLSAFNAGHIYSWSQFNVAFDIYLKRHQFNIGLIFGSSFDLFGFKDPNCLSNNCPTLYLDYKLNYRKFSVDGLEFSYKYSIFSKKNTKHFFVAYDEFSQYKYHDIVSGYYDRIWTKKKFQFLVGYDIVFKLLKKLSIGINLLPGVKFYSDQVFVKNYPTPIANSEFQKFLPAFLVKIDLNYKF